MKQLLLKLGTTYDNKTNLWRLFLYLFISLIIRSLVDNSADELANEESTEIGPRRLLRAFLYKNIIQSNNSQVW
jgi:hypothetical protein